MDYRKTAKEILNHVGGSKNIVSAAHCATRLRLVIADNSKADKTALENADEEPTLILETAAILHDIGIHISEAKYGSASGHYQELEGPAEAEKLMQKVGGYNASQIERVMYLIGHHHTYNNIDGIDYQIIVEADFLVNLYEDNVSAEAVKNARRQIFRTSAGTRLLDNMF